MRYDLLVEDALRGVARKALEHVRDEGLPGEHHFYLTFRADDPGTGVSEALRARHPDEITIVLQHQYWDLVVDDGGFAVTLSFEGVPERLEVPWGALTAFNDPSVQFSLQFQHRRMEGGGPGGGGATGRPTARNAARRRIRGAAQGAGRRREDRHARFFPQEVARADLPAPARFPIIAAPGTRRRDNPSGEGDAKWRSTNFGNTRSAPVRWANG